MTRGHMEAIQTYFPEAADKTFLLREFDPSNRGSLDVPDPIGLGIHAYFEARDTIKRAIPNLVKFIDPDSSSTMSSPQPVATVAAAAPPSAPSTHPLRIALGADHGGVELKQAVHAHLSKKGYIISDFGAYSHESVDYPDYAEPVCRRLIANDFDFGILVCKSGVGMSIASLKSAPPSSITPTTPGSPASTTTPTCCAFRRTTSNRRPSAKSWTPS